MRPASSQISRVTAVSVREGTRVRGRATAGASIDSRRPPGWWKFGSLRTVAGAPYYATVTDGRFDQVVPQSIARGTREGDTHPMLVVLTGIANGPGAVGATGPRRTSAIGRMR